ncbi:hypothetical protein [Roseibacillus ishigakijimensis]|uniref:Uncharacterized protein n=1 Tax=Roseibacillus ishigakijimensis TaxID=454146 RepID=A0A934RSW1_9BACT|nr:hypothetical protein [Roseibacillus ishigakijimensis]MBK1835046.1 hypothetical protein [Roseibacillus ishigakijimensis]
MTRGVGKLQDAFYSIVGVAKRQYGNGPAVIKRTDRRRSIKITAGVDTETNANEVVGR